MNYRFDNVMKDNAPSPRDGSYGVNMRKNYSIKAIMLLMFLLSAVNSLSQDQTQYDILYNDWKMTKSDSLFQIITQAHDSVVINSVYLYAGGHGYYKIPIKLAAFLEIIDKAKQEKEWHFAIHMWDSVSIYFPDTMLRLYPTGPASIVAKFSQAEIYDTYIKNPSKAILQYIDVMIERPDYGSEWDRGSGIVAFSKLIDIIKKYNVQNDSALIIFEELIHRSPSLNVKAIAGIEKSAILFRSNRIEEAECILKDIIHGPPLLWKYFKTKGDFRSSAIFLWKIMGSKYLAKKYVIDCLEQIESSISDQSILWMHKYTLADLYRTEGYYQKAFEYLKWCDNNYTLALGDYPLSFSDHSSLAEEFIYIHRVKQFMKELQGIK